MVDPYILASILGMVAIVTDHFNDTRRSEWIERMCNVEGAIDTLLRRVSELEGTKKTEKIEKEKNDD